jgi:uncharacterized phage-associated protein
MADTIAKKAADYIIAFSHDCGDPISNLKLQKLLYYSQAWYLALYDKPLFDERIEAWVHGPVVPPVYGAYKGWAWQPIQDNPTLDSVGLPGAVKAHLNEIMDAYGSMGAYDLEKLTHSEAPWLNSRGGIPIDQASNALISHEEMKNFYRLAIDGKD